jgi:hypothetical protein
MAAKIYWPPVQVFEPCNVAPRGHTPGNRNEWESGGSSGALPGFGGGGLPNEAAVA